MQLSVTYPCDVMLGSIKVVNRQDCCPERLVSFVIQVLESGNIKWQSAFEAVQSSYTFTGVAAGARSSCRIG